MVTLKEALQKHKSKREQGRKPKNRDNHVTLRYSTNIGRILRVLLLSLALGIPPFGTIKLRQASAKPASDSYDIVVVCNSIDRERAYKVLEDNMKQRAYLYDNSSNPKPEMIVMNASEFTEATNLPGFHAREVVILGGYKAYEGVGDLVKQLFGDKLNDSIRYDDQGKIKECVVVKENALDGKVDMFINVFGETRNETEKALKGVLVQDGWYNTHKDGKTHPYYVRYDVGDPDGDCAPTGLELVWFANPLKKDTDGDGRYGENGPWGLDDCGEIMFTHTDPTKPEDWGNWEVLAKLLCSGDGDTPLRKIAFWVADHYRYLYPDEVKELIPGITDKNKSGWKVDGRTIFEKYRDPRPGHEGIIIGSCGVHTDLVCGIAHDGGLEIYHVVAEVIIKGEKYWHGIPDIVINGQHHLKVASPVLENMNKPLLVAGFDEDHDPYVYNYIEDLTPFKLNFEVAMIDMVFEGKTIEEALKKYNTTNRFWVVVRYCVYTPDWELVLDWRPLGS